MVAKEFLDIVLVVIIAGYSFKDALLHINYQEKPHAGQFLKVGPPTQKSELRDQLRWATLLPSSFTDSHGCSAPLFQKLVGDISSHLHSLMISREGRKYSSQTIDRAMNM